MPDDSCDKDLRAEEIQDLLDKAKKILGIENGENDFVLEWMLRDAIQAILDYCRIRRLPKQLEDLAVGIMVRQFNFENGGNISSIKRGDTTLSYGGTIGIEDFTDKDKRRLNAYRRFVMR